MSLDFTVDKYKELCNAISRSSYITVPVGKYLSDNVKGKVIILRHDVDDKIEYTLKLAKIEWEKGLTSTYYIRMTQRVFKPEVIKEIEGLGHEIGYHYEVLDKAKGDYEKAIEIFKNELAELRRVCDVQTICAHGNPLTQWDNRDLWKHYDFRDFGIIGDAYLSIDYNNVMYFSDTGRTWAGEKYRIKDIVNVGSNSLNIKFTDDLIDLINNGRIERMCILLHLDQWNDNYFSWAAMWLMRTLKNLVKVNVIKKLRG